MGLVISGNFGYPNFESKREKTERSIRNYQSALEFFRQFPPNNREFFTVTTRLLANAESELENLVGNAVSQTFNTEKTA